MVNYAPSLDQTLGALSDATRRALLQRLAGGELSTTIVRFLYEAREAVWDAWTSSEELARW